jgi:heme oxygenase
MTDGRGSKTLSARLRSETRALHARVERAGIMAELLRGRIEKWRYVLLLRNLHPIYAVLDSALHAGHFPAWQAFPFGALQRTRTIEDDLSFIHGEGWRDLPVVEATMAYAGYLEQVQQRAPLLLIAHAYLRHLGDLSGGQILRDRIGSMLSLSSAHGLSFYEYGDDRTVSLLGSRYRAALDGLELDEPMTTAIVAEAERGFLAHERMFVELAACEAPDRATV